MAKLTGVKTIDMVGGEITKVEYNGELYAKVEFPARVGDLAKANRDGYDITSGRFYIVEGASLSGFDFFDDENSEHIWDFDGTFTFYRKVSTQAPSLESRVETLETKVAALEGDEVGDGEYRKVTGRRPRVGDFVKYNSDNDDDDITVGKFYEVVSVDYDGDPRFIDDEGYRTYAADYENWDLYEKVGAEDESIALSVGDYAKITEDIYEYKVGDIVKIISKESNLYYFRVKFVNVTGKSRCDGQTYGFIDRSFATKATEEEVAEANAKAKEAERWAAIGRKPNEFKVGDAVRYKKAFTIVTEVKRGIIRINQSNNVETQIAVQPSDLTLVFPAEAKFE
jgi:hypothetical protein